MHAAMIKRLLIRALRPLGWAIMVASAAFCLQTGPGNAQSAPWPEPQQYHHEVWNEAAGLAPSPIVVMAQTADGYLWIGTGKGLYRFDGVRFTLFDRRNVPGLSDENIQSLAADEEGLWIGTSMGGLFRYRNGAFKRYGRDNGLHDRHIKFLARAVGKLWIETSAGLAVFDGREFRRMFEATIRGTVGGMSADGAGCVWVSTEGRAYRICGGSLDAYALPSPPDIEESITSPAHAANSRYTISRTTCGTLYFCFNSASASASNSSMRPNRNEISLKAQG
jgi:ligand-binding sensor domain-containing protein